MNSTDSIVPENKPDRPVPGVGLTSQNRHVTVFVVDDDPIVRRTLTLLMESASFRVECFASAEEFQTVFDTSNPDCVIIDVSLPGINGISLLEQLRNKGVTTPVIFFTGSSDVTLEAQAIKSGAQDYCEKSRGLGSLLASVRKAIRAGRGVPLELEHTRETTVRVSELTPREREVFELLVSGKENQQVATLLGISPKTVAAHRASLMRKTQSDSLSTLTSRWNAYKSNR